CDALEVAPEEQAEWRDAGLLHDAMRDASESELRAFSADASLPAELLHGQALYMADYLEPGRPFARADRAFLAMHVPRDFDGAFRQVVRHRVEWCLRE